MRQRSDGAGDAVLMVEILRLIPSSSRKITQKEILASLKEMGFEPSKRRLERVLSAMCEHEEFRITCDKRSRPYGYTQQVRNGGLSFGDLTTPECLLIRLTEEYLKYQLPKSVTDSMENIFVHAREKLGEGARRGRAADWISKVAFVSDWIPMKSPEIKPRIFDEISNSLYSENQIEALYRNSAGEQTKKMLSPLGIVQQGSRIYIVAFDHEAQTVKHFAAHRFVEAKQTAFPISRPEGFELDEYVRSRHFNYSNGGKVVLRLEFSSQVLANVLEETGFIDGQTLVRLEDGFWRLEAVVDDSRLVDAWIASWGESAGFRLIERRSLEERS